RTDNRGSADPRHRDALHVPVHIFVSHYRHSHCPPVLGVSARCCSGSIHQFLQKPSDHGWHTTALRAWGRTVFGRRLASPTIGGECLLSGVKRTWLSHRKMSAFDPKRTFGLSLNGLRLDGYDAVSKALGAGNETARVHRPTRRCCDRVVARRERPGETRNWFPQQRISRCLPGSHHSVSSRFATARLY